MRRIAIGMTAAAIVLGTMTATSAAVADEDQTGGAVLKPEVLAAYQAYAASDVGRLVAQQGKMSTPNVYLADVATHRDRTGATPARYWYVRNGVHDDGVSLAPEAVLSANLDRLEASGRIDGADMAFVMNLGHTDNVNTDEAFAWMDEILADAGPSKRVKPGRHGSTGWWDVMAFAEASGPDAAEQGTTELTVSLDGQPFALTQYWGWYAETPNSDKQRMNIYVPENVRPDSPTYFRVNNSGWQANDFSPTIQAGNAYQTGGLAFNSVRGSTEVIGEVLSRGMIVVDYGARSMNDPATDGDYLGHAPATATDTKAAIRFLKQNQIYGSLPGDPNRVIVTGMSGGGALTSIVAASGNSSDYFDSLGEIGAAGLRRTGNHWTNDRAAGDDVFATFSSAPIIDLHTMDYANEWTYNETRRRVAAGEYANAAGITNGRNEPSYLPEWQNLASDVLAGDDGYPAYIRSLGMTTEGVKRTLFDLVEGALEDAVNKGASYQPDLVDTSAIQDAGGADEALRTMLRYAHSNPVPGFEALPLDWFVVSGTPGAFDVTIDTSAWSAFTEYSYFTSQWVKGPPATDGGAQAADFGKEGRFATGETYLWGTPDQLFAHTNPVSWAVDLENWPQLGLTPSTAADDATRQAENRDTATELFETGG